MSIWSLSCPQLKWEAWVAISPKTMMAMIRKIPPALNPGGPRALPLRLLILDQLDHARNNEQHWPVVSEPAAEVVPVQHAHGSQQEHSANGDQGNRPGKRPTVARRRNLDWASHFLPQLGGAWTSLVTLPVGPGPSGIGGGGGVLLSKSLVMPMARSSTGQVRCQRGPFITLEQRKKAHRNQHDGADKVLSATGAAIGMRREPT